MTKQSQFNASLVQQIDQLEQQVSPMLANATATPKLGAEMIAQAARLADNKAERPVFSVDRKRDCEAIRQRGIVEEGVSLESAMELFHDSVTQYGLQGGSGGSMAYIPISDNQLGAVGAYLAAVGNPYTAVTEMCPGAVVMQETVLQWLAASIGYPDSCYGDLTSGGSIANLSAVVTAREVHEIRAVDIPSTVVYYSERTHHSVNKALHIAGLGECQMRAIPTNNHFQLDLKTLQAAIDGDKQAGFKPWLIIGCAGTTDTGAVDDLNTLADIAAVEQCWFHIDAAYGGSFALCPEGRKVLSGIERADSVTLDPHKGLFTQTGVGAILVRHGEQLKGALHFGGSYLRDISEQVSPTDVSPEMTRPFRALPLWLSLTVLGAKQYRDTLSHKMALAQYAHQRLSDIPGVWVGPEPQLSLVVYRFDVPGLDNDKINDEIVRRTYQQGDYFISSTVLDGKTTLRLAVLAAATDRATVDGFIDQLEAMVQGYLSQQLEITA